MRGLNDRCLADAVEVLQLVGGQAHVKRIYLEVRKCRQARNEAIPESIDMIVQRTLETYCSESDIYANSYDLFEMVHGKGQGVYRLRTSELDRYLRDRKVPTLEELL